MKAKWSVAKMFNEEALTYDGVVMMPLTWQDIADKLNELECLKSEPTPPAKSLQECKDEVARQHSFSDWSHLLKAHSGKLDFYINMLIELYASQFKTPPVQKPEFEDDVWDEFFLNDIDWKNLSREELKSKYAPRMILTS